MYNESIISFHSQNPLESPSGKITLVDPDRLRFEATLRRLLRSVIFKTGSAAGTKEIFSRASFRGP